jgi:spore maturation protein CgeB
MIKTILYVGSQYEYSKKENGESLNKRAFFDCFVKLGYDVTPIWYDDDHSDLQEKIINSAETVKPDIVFFILQESQIKADTLMRLKQSDFFTVNWFGDDHWRFDIFTKQYANLFSACITTDKFSVNKYKSIGQKNIIRSEWASLESHVKFEKIEYKYDVSFIGGANSFRRWFVKELGLRKIKVHCFGNGWKAGRVSYEEVEQIFSISKINLNISNSIQYDIRYLMASPRGILNMVRNKKNISQVKARDFEIPVQGGFSLTEYVSGLDECFNVGKEIVCYKDIDEAELLINYYLSNDDERERVKLAGVKKARQHHTFMHRIETFMKDINDLRKQNNGFQL